MKVIKWVVILYSNTELFRSKIVPVKVYLICHSEAEKLGVHLAKGEVVYANRPFNITFISAYSGSFKIIGWHRLIRY